MWRGPIYNFKRWGRGPSPASQALIRQEEAELKELLNKMNASPIENQQQAEGEKNVSDTTKSVLSLEDPNEESTASVDWLPGINDEIDTEFENELSLLHTGKASVRASHENIALEHKPLPFKKSGPVIKKPKNYYDMDKADIEAEKIKDFGDMCRGDNCNVGIVAAGGNSYEFPKDRVAVTDVSKNRAKEGRKTVALLGKTSQGEPASLCFSDDESSDEVYVTASNSDDDLSNAEPEAHEVLDLNYQIPCSATATSSCAVVKHKYITISELISLPIPPVLTESKLTEKIKLHLSTQPTQISSTGKVPSVVTFIKTIDSATSERAMKLRTEAEMKEDAILGESLTLLRFIQQQNRLIDKLIAGILSEMEILEEISKIAPCHSKWPKEKLDVNNGLPLIDVHILHYMIHFYWERFNKDDGYHLQAYLLEGIYPICMLLEHGFPMLESKSTQSITPELLAKLDHMLLEYTAEKSKGTDNGTNDLDELKAFYLINGYYRSLALRSKTKKTFMKQCFAVSTFELYLAYKPEGQISYQNFLSWILGNENLVVALDSDYRKDHLKANIQFFQSDEIKRFVNRPIYGYFNCHNKLPPLDRLAVRSNVAYESISQVELYGKRRKGTCPVTGCNHFIETNKYLAHFIEEHTAYLEEIWLDQCDIFFFNPVQYPDCSHTFCLGVMALNLGRRQLKDQNEELPIGSEDLKNHYPIALMYSKLLSNSKKKRVQYNFWLMTINLPEHINLEAVMGAYPLDGSDQKIVKLKIIQQKDFVNILHLKAEKANGVFVVKFKQMKYLSQRFEQFICVQVKIISKDTNKAALSSTDEDGMEDVFEDAVEGNLDNAAGNEDAGEGQSKSKSIISLPKTPSSST